MADNSPREFANQLGRWKSGSESLRLPRILDAQAELWNRIQRGVQHLARRIRDGPGAPLRVAFFGPTGAGKSKLFSSLIGEIVSTSGFVRPCTLRSVYYLHEDWKALAVSLDGDVESHSNLHWRDIILIDTPDFDSVDEKNRAEAERIFAETDGFLFVTDGLKYADASTWEYLERIRASGKPCFAVLNKTSSQSIVDDYRSKLGKLFETDSPELVVAPELPIDDTTLIPPEHPSIAEIAQSLTALRGSEQEARSVAATLFARGLSDLFESVGAMALVVSEALERLGQIDEGLEERFSKSLEELEVRLTTAVDPAVKGELYQRVLERLEAIDLLRYPRRLLAMPIEGIKSLFSRLRGSDGDKSSTASSDSAAVLSLESFQLLEAAAISYAEASRRDFASFDPLKALLTREEFQKLRWGHEELLEAYHLRYLEFRAWAAAEAQETAAELTGQNKLKFVLSQLMFNSVLVGVQVHTGGGFTLLELGFDGVLSPIVAKAVGMAVSSEKVKEFEQRAHVEHEKVLGDLLGESKLRFAKFTREAADGSRELLDQLQSIDAYSTEREGIVDVFMGTSFRTSRSSSRGGGS